MNVLPKRLAAGLDVVPQAQVVSLARDSVTGMWTATADDGRAFAGRTIVLNLPPAQILPLLAGPFLPAAATEALKAVQFDPCWALLIRLSRDLEGADWPALEVKHPVLAWLSRDHTKRRDPANAPPVLVAHASGSWSRDHLDDDPASVREQVLAAVTEVAGQPLALVGEPVPFRWRYSWPTEAYPHTHFYDPNLALGWCGDWCDGPRVEGAINSGWSLAEALLRT
jgi:hypothetical protein